MSVLLLLLAIVLLVVLALLLLLHTVPHGLLSPGLAALLLVPVDRGVYGLLVYVFLVCILLVLVFLVPAKDIIQLQIHLLTMANSM